MKRFYSSALILAAWGCSSTLAFALPLPGLVDAIAKARAISETEILPKVPGCSVTVAIDGTIMWSRGFGFADLARQTPATPTTRFRVGSISKPLSAVGLALLVEQGKVDLDAPVQKYLPEFPRKGAIITTRMLAGHLSGLRNYRGTEIFSNQAFPTLSSGLKMFENDPLETAPGNRYLYSSYNWNVVGVVMERAAQQEFVAYMQDRVFKPLGMTNTRADYAGTADGKRAQVYEADAAGGYVVAPPVDNSYKWPSGGFLSTTEDLARFGSALLQPGFLKQVSLDLMFTSQKTKSGKVTHYGLGWFVSKTAVYHGGDSIGGSSILYLVPASRTVIAITSNRGHFTFTEVAGSPILQKTPGQFSSTLLLKIAEEIAKVFAPVSQAKHS